MENRKKREINYKIMTKKIFEWKKEIEEDVPLMEGLKKLANK